MKCLQICNALWGSKVHRNLYQKLDELQVSQIIFSPVRENKKPGNKPVVQFSVPDSKIVGSRMIKIYHRILFRLKIRVMYHDLKEEVDLKKIDLTHATTLFSDGAVALKVFKEYQKPYVVTVRTTDINVFFKYRPDLIFLAHKILQHAESILFVSDASQNNFYSHYLMQKAKNRYIPKSKIIYNGIDSFWLANIRDMKKVKPYKILYVGRFTSKKNIPRLVEAMAHLRKNYQELQFGIVGAGGGKEDEIISIADQYDWINYYGPLYDKKELLETYRGYHIFAMPSISETFGLVYVEALSQGLPILYTKGDGFDGVIDQKIGEAVDPFSVESISVGIKNILNDYNSYNPGKVDFKNFDWLEIAKKYKSIYQKISPG